MGKRIAFIPISLFTAFAVTGIFLWINGFSPIAFIRILFTSSWGSATGILLVLTKSALLILTGLAVAIPFRAGLFNIGGEGQMILGALAAALIGALPLQCIGVFHLLLCIIAGILCGSLWGALAGFLKVQRGVHEVIGTIMLNFIAFKAVNELTFGAFSADAGSGRTSFIHESAYMPVLITHGAADTSIGVLISFILAVGLSIVLYRTWFGFEIRAVGENPTASRNAGIAVGWTQFWTLTLGGACAGLAGAIETTGVNHTFYARFTGGLGFDGIAVAFLGLCEPWATIPAALTIATLRASDRALQLDLGAPKEIVFMVEGILIICIAIFTRRRNERNSE